METKDITFVIVTYRSEEVIFECLDLLPIDSKKIVIENSQNADLKNVLENKYHNLYCSLMDENLGYGAGNNVGIKLSQTDYVFILNPDVRFKSEDLKKFLKILNHEQFVIAAPTVVDETKDLSHNFRVKEVEFVKGFAMLLNKKFFINDFFDENIFLYLEEIDLCKRVRDKKGKILRVNVPIVHFGGKSHGNKMELEMEKSRNWHWMWSKFYYKKKHQGYLIALLLTCPNLLSSIIKYLFFSFTKKKIKQNIYKMRFLGLINSYFLRKSFYRPKFD